MAPDKNDDVLPGEDLDSSSCDDDEDDDDEEEEEEENDDVLASASPSTSSAGNDAVSLAAAAAAAANTVTIALPAIRNGDPSPSSASILAATAVIAAAAPAGERKPLPVPVDDSRKLFQRLWTDEDEIELLQGFLDYTSQRGNRTTHHHHGQNDTALFYDQIKSKLQLDFNKNQLVEKLRRLKKKYRNVIGKISTGKDFSFKSPHDQATFEISRKIWANFGLDVAADDDDPSPGVGPAFAVEVKGEDSAGGFAFERRSTPAMMAMATQAARSRKRSLSKTDLRTEDRRGGGGGFAVENSTPPVAHYPTSHGGIGCSSSNGDVRGLIEETVRGYVSPLLKELLHGAAAGPCAAARGFGGLAANPLPMSFGVGVSPVNLGMFGELAASAGDERWRKQQILELEVYSKRLELVQDQIKAALDDLRSRGGS